MNLEVTPEVIAKQLALGDSESTINQVKQAIENTKSFNMFSKHIISFNDRLKHINSYIALSNSKPYFKIKCDSTQESKELITEFTTEVNHFANKYHITLEKVKDKDVYYILGRDN